MKLVIDGTEVDLNETNHWLSATTDDGYVVGVADVGNGWCAKAVMAGVAAMSWGDTAQEAADSVLEAVRR